MKRKRIKLNETAMACIVLIIVAIPLFASHYNNKIARDTLQKQQAKEAENSGFLAK